MSSSNRRSSKNMASLQSEPLVPRTALVRWTQGADKGTFTAGVNVDWIISDAFDPDHFTFCDDQVFTVEWRVEPKPKRGYKRFPCKIYAVSRDILEQEAIITQISGKLNSSPSFHGDGDSTDESSDRSNETYDSNQSAGSGSNGSRGSSPSQALPKSPQELQEAIAAGVARYMLSQQGAGKSQGAKKTSGALHTSPASAPPPEKRKKSEHPEWCNIGNKTFVLKFQLKLAQGQPTLNRMVGALLTAVFDDQTLMSSSYAGQAKTLPDGTKHQLPALKMRKTEAIRETVREKFPQMTQTQFGEAVNRKLNQLRTKKTKAPVVNEGGMSSDSGDELVD